MLMDEFKNQYYFKPSKLRFLIGEGIVKEEKRADLDKLLKSV